MYGSENSMRFSSDLLFLGLTGSVMLWLMVFVGEL